MKQKVAQILELQKVRLLKYILVSQSTFSALLETNGCPNQIKLDNICVEKRRCLEDLMDTAVHSLLNWKVYLEPSKKQEKKEPYTSQLKQSSRFSPCIFRRMPWLACLHSIIVTAVPPIRVRPIFLHLSV